jgi:flagellar biosynthesis/type III secretory pathway chaperone
MQDETLTTYRRRLEQVLVQQFRLLEDLIALSKKERIALLSDPAAAVQQMVEDKEVMLDALSLLEDQCRQVIQEIALEVHVKETSIQALLPFFTPQDSTRIHNLSEGIYSLASQARELNHASQALAITKLDWVKATQLFLISMFQPESGYRSPRGGVHHEPSTGLGVEFRA